MKRTYLFSILLFLSVYVSAQITEEQDQPNSLPNLTTTTNAQKALLAALRKESTHDFDALFSKDILPIMFPEKIMLEKFSKKYNNVPLDTLKNYVKQWVTSDDLYGDVLKFQREVFLRSLARGKELGIRWSETNWTSCNIDSSQQNELGRVYKGNIFFTCKAKSYIIKQEFTKVKNSFIITDLMTPYVDPFGSFDERISTFLNDQIKSKRYSYSDIPYKKEKNDSILLKDPSVEFVKAKVLKNTATQQTFSFLFIKYKSEAARETVYQKLAHSFYLNKQKNNEKLTNRIVYVVNKNELIVFKTSCNSKEESWNELRNELISTLNTSGRFEQSCGTGVDDFIPPPPPPLPLDK